MNNFCWFFDNFCIKSKELSLEEAEPFRKAALNAIQADVQRRLLDLKIGALQIGSFYGFRKQDPK